MLSSSFSRVFTYLLELGVQVGSELSIGYNTQYNMYVLGVFTRKEYYAEHDKYLKRDTRHSWGRYRKIPVIDVAHSLFFLRRAIFFIKAVGKMHGRVLFYNNTLTDTSETQRRYTQTSLSFTSVYAHIFKVYRHAFVQMPWIRGTLSNYYEAFFWSLLNLYLPSQVDRYYAPISFVSLLLRLILTQCFSVPSHKTYMRHHQELRASWRAALFVRYFKEYYFLPDVIVTVNPTGTVGPIEEGGALGIPVICPVDTAHDFRNITYPLLSNDQSMSICLFYFQLFINAYEIGRMSIYSNLFLRQTWKQRSASTYYNTLWKAWTRENSRLCTQVMRINGIFRNLKQKIIRSKLPMLKRLRRLYIMTLFFQRGFYRLTNNQWFFNSAGNYHRDVAIIRRQRMRIKHMRTYIRRQREKKRVRIRKQYVSFIKNVLRIGFLRYYTYLWNKDKKKKNTLRYQKTAFFYLYSKIYGYRRMLLPNLVIRKEKCTGVQTRRFFFTDSDAVIYNAHKKRLKKRARTFKKMIYLLPYANADSKILHMSRNRVHRKKIKTQKIKRKKKIASLCVEQRKGPFFRKIQATMRRAVLRVPLCRTRIPLIYTTHVLRTSLMQQRTRRLKYSSKLRALYKYAISMNNEYPHIKQLFTNMLKKKIIRSNGADKYGYILRRFGYTGARLFFVLHNKIHCAKNKKTTTRIKKISKITVREVCREYKRAVKFWTCIYYKEHQIAGYIKDLTRTLFNNDSMSVLRYVNYPMSVHFYMHLLSCLEKEKYKELFAVRKRHIRHDKYTTEKRGALKGKQARKLLDVIYDGLKKMEQRKVDEQLNTRGNTITQVSLKEPHKGNVTSVQEEKKNQNWGEVLTKIMKQKEERKIEPQQYYNKKAQQYERTRGPRHGSKQHASSALQQNKPAVQKRPQVRFDNKLQRQEERAVKQEREVQVRQRYQNNVEIVRGLARQPQKKQDVRQWNEGKQLEDKQHGTRQQQKNQNMRQWNERKQREDKQHGTRQPQKNQNMRQWNERKQWEDKQHGTRQPQKNQNMRQWNQRKQWEYADETKKKQQRVQESKNKQQRYQTHDGDKLNKQPQKMTLFDRRRYWKDDNGSDDVKKR